MIELAKLRDLTALIAKHRELGEDLQILEGVIARLRSQQSGQPRKEEHAP